jgi:hypothetical protein
LYFVDGETKTAAEHWERAAAAARDYGIQREVARIQEKMKRLPSKVGWWAAVARRLRLRQSARGDLDTARPGKDS